MEPLYKVSKHNSYGVSIIPDEKDKTKSYIMRWLCNWRTS
jgi:hypothetical protein